MLLKIKFFILSRKFVGHLMIASMYRHFSSATSNRWRGLTFDNEITRCLEIFYYEHNLGMVRRFLLKVDIIWSYYRYKAIPTEYFLFDFPNISYKRRSQFLTNKHKDDVMRKKVGMGDNWYLLEDKGLFYKKFHQFFKRDVLIYDNTTKIDEIKEFCNTHSKFIIKPKYGQCGKGVEIFDMTNAHLTINSLHDKLTSIGDCVLEELVTQVPEFAALNNTSVNTVRLPSFINSSGFHILKPFIRIGRNGSIVDNANRGGLFCVIDEHTGELLTDGFDFLGNRYEKHPDSNHKLKGWVIPKWKDLLHFAEDLHKTVPQYPYIGWDFALSDKGWCVIEGNWGQFDSEVADKEGIKDKFDTMFD